MAKENLCSTYGKLVVVHVRQVTEYCGEEVGQEEGSQEGVGG